MKLTQVYGNTWVIEAYELIPFYKLDENHCILLDSGLSEECEELDRTLAEAHLVPVGILCSHAHEDHCGNNRYFQEKYGAQVALTSEEAGSCGSLLSLKGYFSPLPISMVKQNYSCMIHSPNLIIPSIDCSFSFCGITFDVLHTCCVTIQFRISSVFIH